MTVPLFPTVCHVSPTYFAPESVLGGGERYAEELARAMGRVTPVKLVAFGPRALREQIGPHFERVILASWTRDPMTPFSPRLWAELEGADIVHCHQHQVLPTFLACGWARGRGRAAFITDLGGGGWTPGYHADPARWARALLPLSAYAASGVPSPPCPVRVIGGGVDLAGLPMRSALEHDGSVVFLGRVLPHKGLHFLLEAMPPERPLHVLGTVADPAYRSRLEGLARGKQVHFHTGLDDEAVRAYLRRAMALVHPTPVDRQGSAGAFELFGLALVEAMASGCPVVASNVASLPEIVVDGETGRLVPPNQPEAIRQAVEELAADPERWRAMAQAARTRVEAQLTWDHVVERCLAAYAELGG